MTAQAAASRLGDFMPREFVGFFFFDGEDIKSLAEADGKYQNDIDRLLRITFVDDLAKEVRKIAGERGQSSSLQRLRESIRKTEEALARFRSGRDTARQELDRLAALLAVDQADLRRQMIKRENLSGGASEAQRQALEDRQSELRASLARAEDEIIERAPADAPMLANLGLLVAAEQQLRQRLEILGSGAVEFTGRIAAALPGWLDEIGLPRDRSERGLVVTRLREKMADLTAASDSGGPFGSLEPLHAQRMLDDVLRWTSAGQDLRRSQLSLLAQVRRYRRDLADLAEELIALEVGSQANVQRYREAASAVSELERRVAEYNQLIGRYKAQLTEIDPQERQATDELRALRMREEEELKGQSEARFILRIGAALTDLRDGLRTSLRAQVETTLNERFKSLLYDNEAVDRIEVDESYTLSFYSRLGDRIGRSMSVVR